jgi:hypothetical protein
LRFSASCFWFSSLRFSASCFLFSRRHGSCASRSGCMNVYVCACMHVHVCMCM